VSKGFQKKFICKKKKWEEISPFCVRAGGRALGWPSQWRGWGSEAGGGCPGDSGVGGGGQLRWGHGASSLLPAGQGMVEPDMSADPSLGKARLVKELESQAGPPFRVVSAHETSEAGASSVVLSPPSEPFLYLSPDTSSLANPFPGVTSQDTMSSPCLSDSALQVASEQGPK
jgi:hypothetical protein